MTKRIISDPSLHGWIEENGKWVWNSAGGGGGAGLLISAIEPTGVGEGTMWMDTSTSPAIVWIWDGAAWVEFPFVGGGSGGSGGGSGPKLPELQYLVIGGGGNSGLALGTYRTITDSRGHPGGGGAGGYRTNVPGDRSGGDTDPEVTPAEFLNIPAYSQFVIKIGGGAPPKQVYSYEPSTWHVAQVNGQPSAIEQADGTVIIQSEGGGSGGINSSGSNSDGDYYVQGTSGGSGGGTVGGTGISGGAPAVGQGFAGGMQSKAGNGNPTGGGGGGGAGGQGFSADGQNSRYGQMGGPGLVSSIDGLNLERAGGGGAPGDNGDGTGGGGAGDGYGAGSNNNTPHEQCNGVPHTGGGAGGVSDPSTTSSKNKLLGSSGGSGIVIVRYLGPQVCFGGEVTSHNGYTVHTFKSDGVFSVGSLA